MSLENFVQLFRPAGSLRRRESWYGVWCWVSHHFLLQVPEYFLHPGAELATPAQTAAGASASSQRPIQLLLCFHEQVHPQVWVSFHEVYSVCKALPWIQQVPRVFVSGTVWQMDDLFTCTDCCCSITSRNFAPSWTPKRSPQTPTPSTGCVFVVLSVPFFVSLRWWLNLTVHCVYISSKAGQSLFQSLPSWCYTGRVGLLPPAGWPLSHLLPHTHHPCQCQVRTC